MRLKLWPHAVLERLFLTCKELYSTGGLLEAMLVLDHLHFRLHMHLPSNPWVSWCVCHSVHVYPCFGILPCNTLVLVACVLYMFTVFRPPSAPFHTHTHTHTHTHHATYQRLETIHPKWTKKVHQPESSDRYTPSLSDHGHCMYRGPSTCKRRGN